MTESQAGYTQEWIFLVSYVLPLCNHLIWQNYSKFLQTPCSQNYFQSSTTPIRFAELVIIVSYDRFTDVSVCILMFFSLEFGYGLHIEADNPFLWTSTQSWWATLAIFSVQTRTTVHHSCIRENDLYFRLTNIVKISVTVFILEGRYSKKHKMQNLSLNLW